MRNVWTLSLFALLAIISWTPVSFLKTQSISDSTENKYVNENCGVSIDLPYGWTAEDSDFNINNKSKSLAKIQSEKENIYRLEFSLDDHGYAKMPPREILNALIDNATMSPNARVIDSQNEKFNGFPGYVIVYSSTSSPIESMFYTEEILVMVDDKGYRLRYQAANKNEFDTYKTAVEDLADTIQIFEPNSKEHIVEQQVHFLPHICCSPYLHFSLRKTEMTWTIRDFQDLKEVDNPSSSNKGTLAGIGN